MSRIEAVITDFGGVLTSPLLDAFGVALDSSQVSFHELGRAMVALTERESSNPLFELETGRLTEAAFFGMVSSELSALRGSEVDLDGFGERWFGGLSANERLIAYMRELGERGYKLAICTNNIREWEDRWRAMLPVDEIFDVVVDSAFEGTRKPEPRIYQLTLERLGTSPEATLFIDDIDVNCEAARQLGMIAIQFHSTDQAIQEIEAALSRD